MAQAAAAGNRNAFISSPCSTFALDARRWAMLRCGSHQRRETRWRHPHYLHGWLPAMRFSMTVLNAEARFPPT